EVLATRMPRVQRGRKSGSSVGGGARDSFGTASGSMVDIQSGADAAARLTGFRMVAGSATDDGALCGGVALVSGGDALTTGGGVGAFGFLSGGRDTGSVFFGSSTLNPSNVAMPG